MCPEEIFEGKNFQIKTLFSPSVCDFELMIFRILAENVASVTKAAFYLSRLTFCQKMFWRKRLQHFRIFREKIAEFPRESVQKKVLREQILHKKGNSNLFLNLREKDSNSYPKIFSRAVRTAFYVSRGWNPGKKFFGSINFFDVPGLRADVLGLLANSFMLEYQLCNFCSEREVLGETYAWNLGASDSRNSSVKRCGFVLENLSVGLSKTNPTCPDDLTREKHFSKFSSLPLLLDYKQKLFSEIWQKNYWRACRNCPVRFEKV